MWWLTVVTAGTTMFVLGLLVCAMARPSVCVECRVVPLRVHVRRYRHRALAVPVGGPEVVR